MPTVDFTSAYRDATKGSTIKALQQRRAEMEAANIERKPRPVANVWQGAANVADTISGAIREGRLANQEAAGRERFAQLLAGGLAPDEIGEALGLDPETTMKFQERTWAKEDTDAERAARRAELEQGHGWDVEAATARVKAEQEAQAATFGHQDTSAETLAKTQEAAAKADDERAAAEARIKAGEAATQAEQTAAMSDDATQVQLAVKNGYLTPEEGKARIDAINAKAANAAMSPGLEEQNKKFAVDALEWKQQGAASVKTQIVQTQNALNLLDKTKQNWLDRPGYVMGVAEQLPDWAQSVIGLSSSDTAKARDSLRTAVQQSLKAVLGSQYTEREGVQVLDRAFSTSMNPTENIRRAKLVMEQIQRIAAAKQSMVDYYDKNNSNLAGYAGPALDTGALETLDFEGGEGGEGGGSGADSGASTTAAPPSEEDIQETMRANNMTREQVMDALAQQGAR